MRQIQDAGVGQQQDKCEEPAAKKQRSKFYTLVEACKRKDLEAIRRALADHPELLNHHDKHHRNLLHYTSILVIGGGSGDQKRSLHSSQEVETLDRHKEQEEARERARCLECFRFLAERCEPALWLQRDQDGLSVLHLAVISCNVPLVREILFNRQQQQQQLEGLDLSSRLVTALDKEHHAPLHWAVITDNLECVRLLVANQPHGVQLAHQADLNGATPLHYATQTSDYPKYRQQLRQMLKNATAAAASSGSPPPPPLGASTSRSPSSSAAQSTPSPVSSSRSCDSSASLPALANSSQQQSNPQQQQQQQQRQQNSETSPVKKYSVQHAETLRSLDETGSCSAHNLEILKFLAQLPGVNLECRDKDLRTPLLWAASSGNRGAILLLLQSGADPLSQDANKLGPLHCAASHGYTDCLECFLSSAAVTGRHKQHSAEQPQVNQPDNLACTPLFYAVLSGNIDCVELLLERGARHDWQDVKGRTAAHFAALKGQLNTLKLLEGRGANLWLANKQGDLPLHYAIKSGRQQVVAWLLERSPYERAVNAINNTGRAPIHLALLKGNPAMVEFLVRQGANLNQLVKVREKSPPESSGAVASDGRGTVTRGSSSFRYETALDMARRLGARDCLELLKRHSAQSAAWVMAQRAEQQQQPQPQRGQQLLKRASSESRTGNGKSLFDLRAGEAGSTPIGFETSGSSAEPPALSEHSPVKLGKSAEAAVRAAPASTHIPKLPGRPEPLVESAAPQSDSTNSSALSQSSLTSVRGARPGAQAEARARDWRSKPQPEVRAKAPRADREHEREREGRQAADNRPYRGGINYHNERINASIKCKLYESQLSGRSFPPLKRLDSSGRPRDAASQPHHAQYHSAGSLLERGATTGGQQEIITNVNVYTTSPHCGQCTGRDDALLPAERCQDCSRRRRRAQTCETNAESGGGAARRHRNSGAANQRGASQFSETSDTSDATSEILYDEDEDEEEDGEAGGETDRSGTEEQPYLPPLAQQDKPGPVQFAGSHPAKTDQLDHQQPQQQQQSQQMRYLPPSQAYTQHLPVILSAEEERSTSGDTNNNDPAPAIVSPSDPADLDRHAPADQAARGQTRAAQTASRRVDRYQVRSPAGYEQYGREHVAAATEDHAAHQRAVSMGRATDVRGWSQHADRTARAAHAADYSQVRAKVDSGHRNDSGLSSHFGDDLDGGGASSVGRRSRSWSTLDQQQQVAGGQAPVQSLPLHASAGRGFSPSPLGRDSFIHHDQHQPTPEEDPHSNPARSQTIIRTRRLSVDSAELATSVERSLRKYKQENKLFEELQNLKRSQIRSGRANEALLVKRLVERFRHETQRDTLLGLETYRGPYTYQAYELYLYDQLRRLSRSNAAKLAGARAPHKFTYQELRSEEPREQPLGSSNGHGPRLQMRPGCATSDPYETRDFLEEDLKAELELQRVLGGPLDGGQVQLCEAPELDARQQLAGELLIEPSGALEDIRVRREHHEAAPVAAAAEQLPSGSQTATAQVADVADTRPGEQVDHVDEREEVVAHEPEVDAEPPVGGSQAMSDQSEEDTHADPSSRGERPLAAAAASSSAASSRRSSLEAERERLESLPLRVAGQVPAADDEESRALSLMASEKERRQIEAQALDLTTAIITDALGNVSRAGSPVGERPRAAGEASDDGSPSDHSDSRDTEMPAGARECAQESEPAPTRELAHEDDDEDQEESSSSSSSKQLRETARGRRKSVVNIGNKVEVIYHNVGIEIDTVGESPPSDDDEQDRSNLPEDGRAPSASKASPATQENTALARSAPSGPDKAVQLEQVHEHEEEDDEVSTGVEPDSADPLGLPSGGVALERADDECAAVDFPQARELPVGEADHLEDGLQLEKTADGESSHTHGDFEQEESLEAHTPTSSIVALEPRADLGGEASRLEPHSTLLRRASSPPAPERLVGDPSQPRGSTGVLKRLPGGRRSSVDSVRQIPTTSDMIVVQRKVFTGFDLDSLRAHRQRQSARDHSLALEGSHAGEQPQKTVARPARPARLKLQLPRSCPPSAPYRIFVPTELIHTRWLNVKRHERRRMRLGELETITDPHLLELAQKAQEPARMAGEADGNISHARSQSSLVLGTMGTHDHHESDGPGSSRLEPECNLDRHDIIDYPNFLLIYELNKVQKPSCQEAGVSKLVDYSGVEKQPSDPRVSWCQRRLTRIVDVRTLKRTISLPECLLYSNDLLKRFNILKL